MRYRALNRCEPKRTAEAVLSCPSISSSEAPVLPRPIAIAPAYHWTRLVLQGSCRNQVTPRVFRPACRLAARSFSSRASFSASSARIRRASRYSHVRWLFSLLYVCGLRISEVVTNTMECFFCRRDRAGEERWWLEITGKGNKTRIVPATNELMVELARCRRELKLPPLPLSGETAPLLFPIRGRSTPPAIRFRDMAVLCHISALYFASLPCQQSPGIQGAL
jgi:hypothetical protein